MSYDHAGNITKLARQGRNGQPWEISYDYDLKDRVIHSNDYLGPVFQYEYDKNDRLLKETLSGTELKRFYTYSYLFFVKHFSLKKASEFPFFSKGISLLSAGIDYASRRMRACSIR